MILTTPAIKIRYKEKDNAFIKNCKCGSFSLVVVIKLGGSMTEIFSVGLQNDRQGSEGLTEFMTT